jgi:hypothetical protein
MSPQSDRIGRIGKTSMVGRTAWAGRIGRIGRTSRIGGIGRTGGTGRTPFLIGGAGLGVVTRTIHAGTVLQGINPRPKTIGLEPCRHGRTIDDEEVLARDPFPVLPGGRRGRTRSRHGRSHPGLAVRWSNGGVGRPGLPLTADGKARHRRDPGRQPSRPRQQCKIAQLGPQ